MLLGRDVNWEDEWQEKEGLVVQDQGRMMATEEWSMGEEALVMERRVIGRESTTFAWGSTNSVAPERSQIQLFPSYHDLVKCNIDVNTKASWVCAHYKCVVQKLNSVHLSDGRTPGARLNCCE